MAVYGTSTYGTGLYGADIPSPPPPPPDPRFPAIGVELALVTQPTQAPAWTAVTNYVQAWSFSRGRPDEWTPMQAGSGTLRLDNRDRRFDPTYTAGPYYGLLKRMRRGRIVAYWGTSTFQLFNFYIERWPQAWSSWSGGDAYVDLPLVDGLAVLARYELNTSYPQERTDQRITRVLNDVLWTTGQGWLLEDPVYSQLEVTTYLGPVGDRALDTGSTVIQASTLSGENALSHLQAVEKSEGGLFFLSANGGMTLYNRRRRSTNAMRPVAIFGDRPDNGELLYVDAQVTDYTPQASSVAITQQGGSTVVVEDAVTKADSFPATVSYTVLTASLAEIDDAAHWWLARIKSPEHRLSGIDLDGLGDPTALWPTLLGAEIGDMVTVRRRPQAIGAVMERNCYIEQVQHSWSVSAAGIVWDTHWALSTADGRTYWILDLNSTLDVNAILGY